MAFVYVVNSAARTPVYHDQAGVRAPGAQRRFITRCDLAVEHFDAVLRLEHAQLFCRPCKRCFILG